jgi:hypothetical protein
MAAIVSGVIWRERWMAHSSIRSSRIAPASRSAVTLHRTAEEPGAARRRPHRIRG